MPRSNPATGIRMHILARKSLIRWLVYLQWHSALCLARAQHQRARSPTWRALSFSLRLPRCTGIVDAAHEQ